MIEDIKCFNCGEYKSPSMFYNDIKCPNRQYKSTRCIACSKAHKKEWWEKNKIAASQRHKEWLLRNAEKVRAYQKQYDAARAEARKEYGASRPEQNKAAARRYASRHPDKIMAFSAQYYEKNSDAIKAKCAEYRKNNKGYFVARNTRRKASKLSATPSWANQDAIREIYNWAAASGLSVDHVVPLKNKIVCGLHCEANLQLLPLYENIKKSNRHWPDMP